MFHENQQIGNYHLIRRLGRGGFGEVWLAERKGKFVTTKVAVKLPLDDLVDHEAIKHEATLWERASGHPNVLPIIEADEYDGQVVIVSEYAPDGSLEDLLESKKGKLPVIQAVELIIGILNGLEFLHTKRIIHRDLKPANILLQGEIPRLADFGISRIIKTTSLTATTNPGSPYYMSPEAFQSKRNEQGDIWSIGVILYQLLTSEMPFQGNDFGELLYAIINLEPKPLSSEIPPVLQKITTKALTKDLAQRYKTARKMREDLQYALTTLVPHSTSPTQDSIFIPKEKQLKTFESFQSAESQTEIKPELTNVQLETISDLPPLAITSVKTKPSPERIELFERLKAANEKAGELGINERSESEFTDKPIIDFENEIKSFEELILNFEANIITNLTTAKLDVENIQEGETPASKKTTTQVLPPKHGELKKPIKPKLTITIKGVVGFLGLLILVFSIPAIKRLVKQNGILSQATNSNIPSSQTNQSNINTGIKLSPYPFPSTTPSTTSSNGIPRPNITSDEEPAPIMPVNTNRNNHLKLPQPLILPNGDTLPFAINGSVQEKLFYFLRSDEYKRATNSTLKNKWFDFPRFVFDFRSTKFLPTMTPRVDFDEIVKILRAYPDTKIRIGAATTVKGNELDDYLLSLERATAIQKYFIEAGVGSQVPEAAGYGSTFCKSGSHKFTEVDTRITIGLIK